MRAAALLLCALALGERADPLAREWWVRAAALDPGAHAGELHEALRSRAWRARAEALDALARAAEDGDPLPPALLEAARAALDDSHPTVRARALQVLGAARAPLAPEAVARLEREPLASLRLELARALGFSPSPGRAALLARLGLDADARVREAARLALAGLEPDEEGVGGARLELLAAVGRDEDLEAWARLLLALARGPLGCHGDEAWIARARRQAAELDAGHRALLEALAFASLGRGDAASLARGTRDEALWEVASARLLRRAGRAGSEALASELLRALASDGDGEVPSEPAHRGRIGLLLESLEPRPVDALARAGTLVPVELLAELLRELGLRRDVWPAEACAAWCAPEAPRAVREALLGAVAGATTRDAGKDPGAEALLIQFLADPEAELAARAFEVLAASRSPSPAVDAGLHDAFFSLSRAEQAARLGDFAREASLPSFRQDWIALGGELREVRAASCELLASFVGDAPTRTTLEAWLAEDLARLPPEGASPRELEQVVQAELRALASVSRGESRPAFRAALERALGRSAEIGKVAVAALGRTPEGRAELEAGLGSGLFAHDVDRRLRIEAAIALACEAGPEARAEAVAWLIADRTGASWELRERMLRALAASGVAAARAELLRLVRAPEPEPVERAAIATFLGVPGDEEARAALRELVRSAPDLETRRVALRALSGTGDETGLRLLFGELRGGALTGEPEELALLRGELLAALGRLDPLPEGLCAEWLERPLAAASSDLEERFAGRELAGTEFVWRNELELARALARSGHAAECLEASGAWERLDGRLLGALGEVLEGEGDPAAETLLRAAAHALAGERDPDAGRLAWIRARRLGLAWRAGAWARAAALAEGTLAARREGAFSDSRWSELFGPSEPWTGSDPDARLGALLWQARARDALERGALPEAREAAARAETRVGRSEAAREEQRRLARALTQARAAAELPR